MNVEIFNCTTCAAHYFPARLRCHRCGSTSFEGKPLSQAEVTGVVPVHRIPEDCNWRCLVELRTETGITLIAVSETPPPIGTLVRISQTDEGAIVISKP
ncbi:zinc ribbon domain-containing protein [Comamonas sp. F1-6]|uniref:zinc ribbon domain-containing protein n=1 Tax=Comamonas sp. F1-6 TaxID=673550 RepID=UPI0031D32648